MSHTWLPRPSASPRPRSLTSPSSCRPPQLPLSRGSTPARANSWVRALNKLSQRQLSVRAGEGWHITTEGRLAARGVRTTSGKSQNDEAISEESEGEEGTRDGADVDGDGKADGHVTVWLSEAAKEELKRMGQRCVAIETVGWQRLHGARRSPQMDLDERPIGMDYRACTTS